MLLIQQNDEIKIDPIFFHLEHTVHERITLGITSHGTGINVTSQSGDFQLAPLPARFVPRRLGFANDGTSSEPAAAAAAAAAAGGEDATTHKAEEYVPVTRRSRLPAAPQFTTTKCKDKAVKKAFMSLANGEMEGMYEIKIMPDPVDDHKNEMYFELRVGSPATDGTDGVAASTTTTSAQQQLQGTPLICVTLSRGQKCAYSHSTKPYNERFSNALTLDEKEYLAHRVLHSFLRALASELPYQVLSEAILELDHYYSRKKYFEQTLDLYIIKADVGMTIAEARKTWDFVETLISVGEYLETTAKVNQDHKQAGCVYEFIARLYGSELPVDYCATIHHHAHLAFRNGQDMNKAEEHLVAAWHTLCSRTGGDGVDINGEMSTTILTTVLVMYQMIFEQANQPRARQRAADRGIIDVYPLLCALLYLAGFQARNGGKSHVSVFQLGPQNAQNIFKGRLDQPAARNILIEAGARRDPNHFRQSILQAKDAGSLVYSGFSQDSFPQKDDAKAYAKIMKKQIEQLNPVDEPRITIEPCHHCRAKERPNGQPNLRCPCHKAAYCSKECQASHRKEHKKICIVVPKKGK